MPCNASGGRLESGQNLLYMNCHAGPDRGPNLHLQYVYICVICATLPDQDAAIKALAAALAPRAKVFRDGKLVTLEALNLVPGTNLQSSPDLCLRPGLESACLSITMIGCLQYCGRACRTSCGSFLLCQLPENPCV